MNQKTIWTLFVFMISVQLPSVPLYGLEMDFHGEGIRVTANGEHVNVTDIPEPGQSTETKQESERPDNPFFDEFNVDATGSVYHVDIDGNQRRSFKTDGTNVQADVSAEGHTTLGNGHEFDLITNIRGTDDPQVIPDKRFKLRGMYGEFSKEQIYRLRLGNVSVDLSDYTLSSSADVGAHYEYFFGGDTGAHLQVYGARSQRQTNGQFRQYNGGVRISNQTPTGIVRRYGFSTAYTEDDTDSINGGPRPSTAVENRVSSVDAEVALMPGWTADGEFARSNTDTNTLNDNIGDVNDWALKINSYYEIPDTGIYRNGQLTLQYEEIQPDFRSTSGGGSPDQRRFTGQLRGTVRLSDGPDARTRYRYETNSDNLDDQLARETETDNHRFSMDFSPFEQYDLSTDHWKGQIAKNTDMSVEYRMLDVETSDTTIDRESRAQEYELETRLFAHQLGTAYSYRKNDDQASGGILRRRRDFSLDYAYNDIRVLDLGAGIWPLDLRADFRRTQDWQKNGSSGSDRTTWDLGTTVYPAEQYRFNASWRLEDADNNGGNNDLERTTWLFDLDVSEFYRRQGQLTLSFRVNDVSEEASANSYREEILRADVDLSF